MATTEPFVITRVFDAPRDLVWKAWTEPDRLVKWLTPGGGTMEVFKADFRVGGFLHYMQKTPWGDMWGKMVYREINPQDRIQVIQSFSDAEGNVARAPHSETWPLEMLATTTLAEKGGKTELTLEWAPHDGTAAEIATFEEGRAGMNQGWGGSLAQLEAYLAKEQA